MASLLPHIGTLERNRAEAVALAPSQLKRHCFLAGKSGTGKSTLLRNMIIANLYSGDGLTLLDPHGSLYDDVLAARSRAAGFLITVLLDQQARASVNSGAKKLARLLRPERPPSLPEEGSNTVGRCWRGTGGRHAQAPARVTQRTGN